MRRMLHRSWILVLSLVALPALGDDVLVDRVATLPLERELDARGQLGGVTVDALGFVYVANFRDAVWRISPEGSVEVLARSLYGSSGNAIDSRGDLLQANFFGHTIDRISRTGEVTRLVEEGLQGPVGIAVGEEGLLFVCNCGGNYVATVDPEGTVRRLAEGDLFACPNGITLGPDGALYVTNFNHHDLVRIDPDSGEASRFATVPGGAGNAHIAFSKGFFYVTKILTHRLVKVSMEGEVFPVAGSGAEGHDDGAGPEATFSYPNGIAVSPSGDVLYLNTVVGEYQGSRPSTISLRTVELVTLTKVLQSALDERGVGGLAAAYERYQSDPVRGRENTVAEMIAYGYTFLRARQIAEAVAVFELNAAGYPEVAAAQYQLGEAYRYSGRTDEAEAQYRRALELEPGHPQAKARLAQLGV